jgi:hypothetical protein
MCVLHEFVRNVPGSWAVRLLQPVALDLALELLLRLLELPLRWLRLVLRLLELPLRCLRLVLRLSELPLRYLRLVLRLLELPLRCLRLVLRLWELLLRFLRLVLRLSEVAEPVFVRPCTVFFGPSSVRRCAVSVVQEM